MTEWLMSYATEYNKRHGIASSALNASPKGLADTNCIIVHCTEKLFNGKSRSGFGSDFDEESWIIYLVWYQVKYKYFDKQ
jgi:hypothetical protein